MKELSWQKNLQKPLLNKQKKIVDKLDCVFVYGFAPRSTLENTVRDQAACVARERLNMMSSKD